MIGYHFPRPAFTDATVEVFLSDEEVEHIAAEAETPGKAEFLLKAAVRDANDQVVAETGGIYPLRMTGPQLPLRR
jgi:hypothetical protein